MTPSGLVREVARMNVNGDTESYTANIQMVRKGRDWNSWLLMSSERPELAKEGMSLVVDRRAKASDLFVEIPYS